MSAAVNSVTKMTGASYQIEYTDTAVTITNLATNVSQDITGTSVTLDGVTFTVAFDASMEGDRFWSSPQGVRPRRWQWPSLTRRTSRRRTPDLRVGDNKNMLSLIALREANNLKDGTQSVYDIYNNAVSQVAVDTEAPKRILPAVVATGVGY